jgi:putative tryptophan/tyrosine transport system substrate-binding protein
MRLIGLAVVFVLSLITPLRSEAQLAGKVYRVGILGESAEDPSEARLWQAFRSGLKERGWIEGNNILIESRWAEGNPAPLRDLAGDLVRLKVDVIVTRGSIYTQAAKTATSSIPIVFTMHAAPEKSGHIASLARPGGNVTGLSIVMTDLNVKGLEFLTATVPGAKHVAVLGSPDMPSYTPSLQAFQEAARQSRLQVRTVVARTGADLETAFSAMARDHAGRARPWLRPLHSRETANRRLGPQTPVADILPVSGSCEGGRAHELWPRFQRSPSARRHLRGHL